MKLFVYIFSCVLILYFCTSLSAQNSQVFKYKQIAISNTISSETIVDSAYIYLIIYQDQLHEWVSCNYLGKDTCSMEYDSGGYVLHDSIFYYRFFPVESESEMDSIEQFSLRKGIVMDFHDEDSELYLSIIGKSKYIGDSTIATTGYNFDCYIFVIEDECIFGGRNEGSLTYLFLEKDNFRIILKTTTYLNPKYQCMEEGEYILKFISELKNPDFELLRYLSDKE